MDVFPNTLVEIVWAGSCKMLPHGVRQKASLFFHHVGGTYVARLLCRKEKWISGSEAALCQCCVLTASGHAVNRDTRTKVGSCSMALDRQLFGTGFCPERHTFSHTTRHMDSLLQVFQLICQTGFLMPDTVPTSSHASLL